MRNEELGVGSGQWTVAWSDCLLLSDIDLSMTNIDLSMIIVFLAFQPEQERCQARHLS